MIQSEVEYGVVTYVLTQTTHVETNVLAPSHFKQYLFFGGP